MKPFHSVQKTKVTDVILLQGPLGSFFADLQSHFSAHNITSLRITFDRADDYYKSEGRVRRYLGGLSDWSHYIRNLIEQEKPSKLVVFGDARPHHKMAIEIARQYGVKIWCLEEGYIRPGFIVCERDGNNANSPLSAAILQDNWVLSHQSSAIKSQSTQKKAIYAFKKYAMNSFMTGTERKQSLMHRPRNIVDEAFRWTKNLLLHLRYASHDKQTMMNLRHNHAQHYTVVALQVHDDMQIIAHGDGWDAKNLIEKSISAFRQANLHNHRLVFKIHPFDRGHLPYAQWINAAAHREGLLEQVDILHTGALGGLMKYAFGMITINSTGGLVALSHQKPLMVLGKAFYDRASLTFKGEMTEFWHKALPPDADKWRALRSQIFGRSLLNGCYYDKQLRSMTINNVAERIIKDDI